MGYYHHLIWNAVLMADFSIRRIVRRALVNILNRLNPVFARKLIRQPETNKHPVLCGNTHHTLTIKWLSII